MPVDSPLRAAASVAAFGAGAFPSLSHWTPASVYLSFQALLKSMILLPPVLLVITAPFGRFALPNSLFKLPGRLAFMIMELPAPICFVLALATPGPLSHDLAATSVSGLLSSLISPSWTHVKQLPAANLLLAALFVIHYTHRAIIQPLLGPPRSPSHISVLVSAFTFSLANGFSMGAWIGGHSPSLLVPANLLSGKAALQSVRSASWFAGILPRAKVASPGLQANSILPVSQPGLLPSGVATLMHPLFLLGVVGWAIGFASNVYHDEILANLRRPDKRGGGPAEGTRTNANKATSESSNGTNGAAPRYEVPQGGLYSFISFPNYLSEWFEWFSYAVAAISLTKLSPLAPNALPLTTVGRLALLFAAPPVVFPIIEVAVMLPRAIKGHQWYHAKFGVEADGKNGRYPRERKAVIPFLI